MPRVDAPVPDFALSRSDGTLVRLADFTLSLFFGQLHLIFRSLFYPKISRRGSKADWLTRAYRQTPPLGCDDTVDLALPGRIHWPLLIWQDLAQSPPPLAPEGL